MTHKPRRALGTGIPAPGRSSRAPAWFATEPAPEPASSTDQARDALAALRLVGVPAAAVESTLHLLRTLTDRPAEEPRLRETAEGLAVVLSRSLDASRPGPAATVTPLRPAHDPTLSTIGAVAELQPVGLATPHR
ncbi:hypothetical protein ACFV1L_21875 [Kitasatospora sp. NPDC059646]|uniref:hypothetical protein n=1 Tax=Kitasatospora sp. NPDC059646 TaxID=3346893 RepID=UPI0036A256FC